MLMPKTELDILREVSQRFADAGMAFMLTGSVAMNYHAQPRMTRDIDTEVVVRLFEADYCIDRETVASAIARWSIFNMIHLDSVIKVDCIVRKDEPYRLEEFSRRKEIQLVDFRTYIVSREDLLLSKLVWVKGSGSVVQLRDAANLFVPECDLAYLRSRATLLSVSDSLEELVESHG